MAMTVEQTSQLIQLILNSALMMAVTLAWWGALWLRHSTISTQMQAHQRRVQRLIQGEQLTVETLAYLRQQRYQLQGQQRLMRHSLLLVHYGLLAFMTSLFCLGLRVLFNANWLIAAAMFVFVLGVTGMLLSVLLTLLEFYQTSPTEEGMARPTHRSDRSDRSTARGRRDAIAS